MSHTKEPWGDATHERVPQIFHGYVTSIHYAMSDADKERADLCVNALAGVDDPAAQVARWKADAERYRKLRSVLYTEGVLSIGEADLRFKSIGACPEPHEWDAVIDALAAKGGESNTSAPMCVGCMGTGSMEGFSGPCPTCKGSGVDRVAKGGE